MGLEFEYITDPGSGPMVEATARLCLTEDDRLVPEGDPDGRWLYCVPGRMIPRDEAEKYGLLKVESDPPEVARPDLKAVRAWAEENGLDVPKRGRIPDAVIELYNEAEED